MDQLFNKRVGYGTQFNELHVINNTKVKKESKNEYGDIKIKKEILFLKYIMEYHIPFPVPTIYEFGNNYYVMEYLSTYLPLYKYIPALSTDVIKKICVTICEKLQILHISSIKRVSREHFTRLLQIETKDKIYQRYQEIKPILDSYSVRIQKVNGVPLKTFEQIMEVIQRKVSEYIDSLHEFQLCLIHGDCQFNNIMYNPSTDDIMFIDPRGYFGDEVMYGIPEYDYAKVRFALTGYDQFDNSEIPSLQIQDGNLIIPDMFLLKDVAFDDFIGVLTIAIWLANAHCFKNTIPKAIYSFYYALYLGTKYL